MDRVAMDGVQTTRRLFNRLCRWQLVYNSIIQYNSNTIIDYQILSWNNGNRDPGWGVAEIQKMSPRTTVGDVADMQLCVIKQGSLPVLGNVAFFVTDLLTLARCAVCILVR